MIETLVYTCIPVCSSLKALSHFFLCHRIFLSVGNQKSSHTTLDELVGNARQES